MPHYLRAHVPGGSYFFTVALLERRRRLLTAHVDALRGLSFRAHPTAVPCRCYRHTPRSPPLHLDVTAERCGFLDTLALDQIVFRPRHRAGGAVIIPEADETRTGHLATAILGARDRDQRDFDAHLDYIHFNPVKHGWVSRVADWPHSSFHRYVRSGWYPLEWARVEEPISAKRRKMSRTVLVSVVNHEPAVLHVAAERRQYLIDYIGAP